MDENVFDLICLFYADADSDTVDTGFYQDFLILVPRNRQRIEENFWRARGLYLRDIVPFRSLGSKVCQGESSSQR